MTGQDWLEKDFYAVLGIPKDADQTTIKKAYRKLARKLHPDQNPGDVAAEQRFKDVGEAYAVLSDAEQRSQYDSLRAMAGGGPRFAAGSTPGGGGFEDLFGGAFHGGGGSGVRFSSSDSAGFEDILSSMFGGGGGGGGFRAPRGPQRGADIAAQTTLPFRQAVAGSTVTLGTGGGATITARIPPGVRNGQKIRLRGKGNPGDQGAPAGDIIITVNVTPDSLFSLDGNNLRITVPVTFAEAALGATLDVPTIEGGKVRVKVPAGTPSGRTLRVKGHGVKSKQKAGDLLVTVNVAVPSTLSADAKAAVESFAEATTEHDPRAGLFDH